MKLALILVVAALAMRGRVGPAPQDDRRPQLVDPWGPVQFIPPGSDVWLVARSSRTLENGTRLRTGRDGSVKLKLYGGRAVLDELTHAKLDSPTALYVGGGTARLEGTIAARMPAAYAMPQTAAAYELFVSTGGDAVVSCSSGTVTVKDNGGQSYVLAAGDKELVLRAAVAPKKPAEQPERQLP